jgi:nicotinamidase/pyrazinamidase
MIMLQGPLVFVDIDTQRDFLEESGALYVPGSRSILPNLDRLSRMAAVRAIPVLATACYHSAEDAELSRFPPHCMAGTEGQRRIPETERPDSVILPVGVRLDGPLPPHLTLNKQEFDVFSRPDAGELIARYDQAKPIFVVFGVATDYCVRAAVEGLLARGCRLAVVVDAIRAIDADAEAGLLTDWAMRGTLLVMTDVVCGDPRPEDAEQPSGVERVEGRGDRAQGSNQDA